MCRLLPGLITRIAGYGDLGMVRVRSWYWVGNIAPAHFLDVDVLSATSNKWAGNFDLTLDRLFGGAAWSTGSAVIPALQLHERHGAIDFDTKTQDKIVKF